MDKVHKIQKKNYWNFVKLDIGPTNMIMTSSAISFTLANFLWVVKLTIHVYGSNTAGMSLS